MSLDLISCMQSFAAVVSYQGFSSAARQTHLSTSVLTKQIQRLEATIGKQLFHRTTRSVELTEAGKIYYEHVKKILDSLQEAREAMGSLEKEPHGTIVIHVPSTLNAFFFAKSVKNFLHTYPKINCHLTDTYSSALVHNGEVDLLITAEKIEDKSLIRECLYAGHAGIFAAPSYLQKYGTPRTLADLKKHNCLINTHASPDNKWEFANGKRVTVQGNYRSEVGINTLFAAINGIGIFMSLRVFVTEELSMGKLIEIPLEIEAGKWTVYLYHRPVTQSSNVKLLTDHLVKDMREACLDCS